MARGSAHPDRRPAPTAPPQLRRQGRLARAPHRRVPFDAHHVRDPRRGESLSKLGGVPVPGVGHHGDARQAVRNHAADLALVFDGDADRCFIIDERGEVVNPSAITAMIASQELAREPGATIVCNKITSRTVSEVVLAEGGKIVVSRVGHTFVKAAMAEHNAIFGGEHSAHYYFRDFWGADTGMLAALHVLAAAGHSDRPLSELVARFERYAASGEINTLVSDQQMIMDRVAAAFADRGEQDRLDGLTVSGPDWWVNVRPSNTEPLLRLNVEAASRETMEALREETLGLIRA